MMRFAAASDNAPLCGRGEEGESRFERGCKKDGVCCTRISERRKKAMKRIFLLSTIDNIKMQKEAHDVQIVL
jgi:hypothetical protein